MLVQQCIWQVGRIFLTEHGDSQAALISVLPFEDGAIAQLAFTPLRMEATGAEVSDHSAWQVMYLKQNPHVLDCSHV